MSVDRDEPNKVIYLAPRPEGVEQDAFVPRWHQHAELNVGMSYSKHWTRYELCRLVTPNGDSGEAVTAPGRFGGVGRLRLAGGIATLTAQAADPDVKVAQADELKTFGGRLGGNALLVHEEVLAVGEDPALRLFGFLKRRDDVSPAAFSDGWRQGADRLVAGEAFARLCSGYFHNPVLTPLDKLGHAAGDRQARFDGIAEVGFRSSEDARDFLAQGSLLDQLPGLAPLVDEESSLALLTRPRVFIS